MCNRLKKIIELAAFAIYLCENVFLKQLALLTFIFLCAILPVTQSCNRNLSFNGSDSAIISYNKVPVAYPMANVIKEASGIADSKANPGFLWVEEDSGNPPQLYLLNHSGALLKKVYIKGAVNTDWEDIALASGPDPSKNYLYVADIGDNDAVHASSSIYRFEEPFSTIDTVRSFDVIRFVYEDGPRDAEAFLVDDNKDIYIISKRDAKSRLYKLAYPYNTTANNTAVFVQTLPFNGVVSAALGNDGKGLIIKTYPSLYYFSRSAGETIPQTLQKTFTVLSYITEPQGEAVGFAVDNSGFYTLSEIGNGTTQSLYFYKKN